MEKRKTYVVSVVFGKTDETPSNLKVFLSLLKAKQFCEDEARKLYFSNGSIEPEEYTAYWEDNFTYRVLVNSKEWCFEIESTDLDEDVNPVYFPEIEMENKKLKEENLKLRDKLSKQMAMNAAATCYLTMWDGGWKYTKEHIIENMHAAKYILEGNEEGQKALNEMFENWIKTKNDEK